MSAPTAMVAKDRRAGRKLSRAPGGGKVPTVERRRAPARYSPPASSRPPASPITLSVMRAMVAATDELRRHLSTERIGSLTASELTAAGTEIADLVRRFQAASRHVLRDWLRSPRQSAWRVESASGRILDVGMAAVNGVAWLPVDAAVTVAEDQPLHGLRTRFERRGVGVPVVVWTHRSGPSIDVAHHTAASARTAIVSVEPDRDRRARRVRIELLDPVETATIAIGGCRLPLAADFTAPVTQTLGLEQRPAARAYGTHDSARRGTIDGFSALTPFAAHRLPLILLEGAGHSPLMMAQVANEIAGDPELRRRYQVWLYRFPTVAPLFFAASRLRADLDRLYSRLAASGSPSAGHGTVLAHGVGAVLAKSLLVGSGSSLWDPAFSIPIERMTLRPEDRALLRHLFFWTPSMRIERVAVAGEPRNVEALTAGVGDRAVQLLLHQPPEFRMAIERICGGQKPYMHATSGARSAWSGADGMRSPYPEPICQAVADTALVADRALLALLAEATAREAGAALFTGRGGLVPVKTEMPRGDDTPLGPLLLRRMLDWLRAGD